MIRFLLILSLLLLLFLIKIRIRDKVSLFLIIVYVSLWCGSMILVSFKPYDLYEVNEETYYVLLIHVFAFVIGFTSVHISKKEHVLNKSTIHVEKLLKSRFFLLLFSTCFIFLFSTIIKARYLLIVYSFQDIKSDFADLLFEGNGFTYLFFQIIACSMYHFSLTILSYMLLFDRKWYYIIAFLLYVVIYAILTGGRNQFMTFGFYIFSILCISSFIQSNIVGYSTNYVISFKMKLALSFGLLIIIGAMAIITVFRKGNDKLDKDVLVEAVDDLGERFGRYSSGPIVAFDLALHRNDYFDNNYFGLATISGTHNVFWTISKHLGLQITNVDAKTTQKLQNDWIFVGTRPNSTWNYAYTSCVYYYYDFGLLGVILVPFILGVLMRFVIKRLYTRYSIFDLALFLFSCFCMYMSVFSGYLHKKVSIFYVIFLIILSNRHFRLSKL